MCLIILFTLGFTTNINPIIIIHQPALPINLYLAPNYIMQDSEEVVYYELPPSYAGKLILPMYHIVEGIIAALPGLAFDADFAEMHDSVKERMKVADPEMPFMMAHDDCMVVCEMMSILKFYYYRVIMPNTEVRDSLSEADKKAMDMYEICMPLIKEIGGRIVAVFPPLGEPF